MDIASTVFTIAKKVYQLAELIKTILENVEKEREHLEESLAQIKNFQKNLNDLQDIIDEFEKKQGGSEIIKKTKNIKDTPKQYDLWLKWINKNYNMIKKYISKEEFGIEITKSGFFRRAKNAIDKIRMSGPFLEDMKKFAIEMKEKNDEFQVNILMVQTKLLNRISETLQKVWELKTKDEILKNTHESTTWFWVSSFKDSRTSVPITEMIDYLTFVVIGVSFDGDFKKEKEAGIIAEKIIDIINENKDNQISKRELAMNIYSQTGSIATPFEEYILILIKKLGYTPIEKKKIKTTVSTVSKTYLAVNPIRGINLDIKGKSDTYLVMKLGGQTFNTSAIKKTSNWNENFLFDVTNLNENLTITCFKKKLFKDVSIGEVSIPINKLVPGQEIINTFKLLNINKGEIELGLTLDVDDSPDVENNGTISVEIGINSAKNLVQIGNELPNPYAILYLGEECLMTNERSKTLDPVWEREFLWTFNDANEKIILPICIFDAKKTKKDEFLGLALVPLAGINNEEKIGFYKLHGVTGGEIEISIKTTRKMTEIPISDPNISKNELERKIKFSSQFIKMSQRSQASGLKKFGSGLASLLGIGVQFLVDNSDSLGEFIGEEDEGGNDD